jgi:hypothetical protein
MSNARGSRRVRYWFGEGTLAPERQKCRHPVGGQEWLAYPQLPGAGLRKINSIGVISRDDQQPLIARMPSGHPSESDVIQVVQAAAKAALAVSAVACFQRPQARQYQEDRIQESALSPPTARQPYRRLKMAVRPVRRSRVPGSVTGGQRGWRATALPARR